MCGSLVLALEVDKLEVLKDCFTFGMKFSAKFGDGEGFVV